MDKPHEIIKEALCFTGAEDISEIRTFARDLVLSRRTSSTSWDPLWVHKGSVFFVMMTCRDPLQVGPVQVGDGKPGDLDLGHR